MREVGDLYLSAALRLRGHQPERVLGDGRRCVWVFSGTPDVESDVAAYYDGSLSLPAHAFAEAVRTAKAQAMNANPDTSQREPEHSGSNGRK